MKHLLLDVENREVKIGSIKVKREALNQYIERNKYNG